MKMSLLSAGLVSVFLLIGCNQVEMEEIERAGKAYPSDVLTGIVSACMNSCTERRPKAQCQRICKCKRGVLATQLPYKTYLKLKQQGQFELKSTINRMTMGCSRQ